MSAGHGGRQSAQHPQPRAACEKAEAILKASEEGKDPICGMIKMQIATGIWLTVISINVGKMEN